MDAVTADLIGQSMASAHAAHMQNVTMAGLNLSQGLGVIHNTVIQAQAAVSDDSEKIAALQTASRSPVQGSNDTIK